MASLSGTSLRTFSSKADLYSEGPPPVKRARLGLREVSDEVKPADAVEAVAHKAIAEAIALPGIVGGAGTASAYAPVVQASFLIPGTPPRGAARAATHSDTGSPVRGAAAASVSVLDGPFKVHRNLTGLFVQNALNIHENGFITKDAAQFRITSIAGAKGQHAQVYAINGPSRFIDGVENASIVIKLFQHDVILKKGKPGIEPLVRTLLKQYAELCETDLPIVKIYNSSTAFTDGYIVAEKVTPFAIPWDESTTIESLREDHLDSLNHLKRFIDFAATQKTTIPLDLNRGNFGINTEGNMVLLDFMEHEEDDVDLSVPGAAFNMIKENCLASLSLDNPHVKRYLGGGDL